MHKLETKAETDARLQIVPGETRINFLRREGAVTNDRITDINPNNCAATRIIFKHAADIYVKKRDLFDVRGGKKIVVRRSNLISYIIFVNLDKTRSDFTENSKSFFSDTNFRS